MYRILVIDDDPEVVNLVRHSLPYDEFAISAANGSIEAQSKIKQQKFNLIFLDIDLGNIDGLELLKFFNQLGIVRNIPVVMLTANATRDQVIKAAEYGAQGFIRKPFKPKTLQDQIYRILALQDIQEVNKKSPTLEKQFEIENEELFTKIVISDKLSDKIVREIFTVYDKLTEKFPVVAIDLRNQSQISEENIVQLKILRKLLSESRFYILAGRNFGDLISAFAQEETILFISEIDLRRQLRQERG